MPSRVFSELSHSPRVIFPWDFWRFLWRLETFIGKYFGVVVKPPILCTPIAAGTKGKTWSNHESSQVCLLEHIFCWIQHEWSSYLVFWEQLFGLLRKGQFIGILFKVLSNATLLPITYFSCCSKFLALCSCKQLIQSFINALLNWVLCKSLFSNRKKRKYESTFSWFIMAL